MATSISEADKCYADAMKAIQPSIWTLRFTADWTEATPLFERAARLLKVGCLPSDDHPRAQQQQRPSQVNKDYTRAMLAYERAAEGQLKLGSAWHAGKHLEAAADAARHAHQFDRVQDFTDGAIEAYLQVRRRIVGGRI